MNASEINDIRQQPAFRGISFSKYKKTDVKDQFIENLLNAKGKSNLLATGRPNLFAPATFSNYGKISSTIVQNTFISVILNWFATWRRGTKSSSRSLMKATSLRQLSLGTIKPFAICLQKS